MMINRTNDSQIDRELFLFGYKLVPFQGCHGRHHDRTMRKITFA